ncbi:MAG: hypothetical protein IH852_14540 [Bacteroidetes bacterium]|nr:hypothetical protein [Bacteroidota bacterium]
MSHSTIKYITSIIVNKHLASALYKSISKGLTTPYVKLLNENSVKDVFTDSLNLAIRDIQNHPRGHLFKRLIEYGPLNPDEKDSSAYKANTILSDKECISAVNFIFSFIINRFKGELAELLAIEPCIKLVENLKEQGSVTKVAFLCFGDYIHEYQKKKGKIIEPDSAGSLAKGADGLIVKKPNGKNKINVEGVIEIKSMYVSPKKLMTQISKHISRLQWGLVLGNKKYSPDELNINEKNILRIMIIPSSWQVNRKFEWGEIDGVRSMIFPEPDFLQEETIIEEVETNTWKIKFHWSHESLEQAAYEMTFWYMSQVGKSVYNNQTLPKNWEGMSAQEAGYNSIKEKLYYILLRPLTKRQGRRAIKLYNVYSFGYPLGIDSKEMLWPEDINKLGK